MTHDKTADATIRQLLAELATLKELDRRRLATTPGTEARVRATAAVDQKNAELMERFRQGLPTARRRTRSAG